MTDGSFPWPLSFPIFHTRTFRVLLHYWFYNDLGRSNDAGGNQIVRRDNAADAVEPVDMLEREGRDKKMAVLPPPGLGKAPGGV